MKERQINQQIKKYIHEIGGISIKYPGSSPFAEVFVPDLLIMLYGKFIACETKSKRGKLSKGQEIWLQNFRNRGGIAFVAHSLQDFKDALFWHKLI